MSEKLNPHELGPGEFSGAASISTSTTEKRIASENCSHLVFTDQAAVLPGIKQAINQEMNAGWSHYSLDTQHQLKRISSLSEIAHLLSWRPDCDAALQAGATLHIYYGYVSSEQITEPIRPDLDRRSRRWVVMVHFGPLDNTLVWNKDRYQYDHTAKDGFYTFRRVAYTYEGDENTGRLTEGCRRYLAELTNTHASQTVIYQGPGRVLRTVQDLRVLFQENTPLSRYLQQRKAKVYSAVAGMFSAGQAVVMFTNRSEIVGAPFTQSYRMRCLQQWDAETSRAQSRDALLQLQPEQTQAIFDLLDDKLPRDLVPCIFCGIGGYLEALDLGGTGHSVGCGSGGSLGSVH